MSAAVQLAARYVLRHRFQSALLAGALGLVFTLPLCLRVLIDHAQRELCARAAATSPESDKADARSSCISACLASCMSAPSAATTASRNRPAPSSEFTRHAA